MYKVERLEIPKRKFRDQLGLEPSAFCMRIGYKAAGGDLVMYMYMYTYMCTCMYAVRGTSMRAGRHSQPPTLSCVNDLYYKDCESW